MLIGIDMLGIQSPMSFGRESARSGRRLVEDLLALDLVNRYVFYLHEGLPTDLVPIARNALRVSFGSGPSSVRSTTRRRLVENPDGLDWFVLLDPFHPGYGDRSPESPLDGVKVASVLGGFATSRLDDRRLAGLRKHDVLLTYSESAAEECRRRLPDVAGRVDRIGVALGEERIGSGMGLDELGITGPFLFSSLADGSGLGGLLEMYRRLPEELRSTHQLVVAGEVADPWSAVAYLHRHGCAEGLVLVGEVDESTARTLNGRCSAFVWPGSEEGSGLDLIEAMGAGAALVAIRSPLQDEIVGEAGWLADPIDPSDLAEKVADVLVDVHLRRELRDKALARSNLFSRESVVDRFLTALGANEPTVPRPTHRFDRAHEGRELGLPFATTSNQRVG